MSRNDIPALLLGTIWGVHNCMPSMIRNRFSHFQETLLTNISAECWLLTNQTYSKGRLAKFCQVIRYFSIEPQIVGVTYCRSVGLFYKKSFYFPYVVSKKCMAEACQNAIETVAVEKKAIMLLSLFNGTEIYVWNRFASTPCAALSALLKKKVSVNFTITKIVSTHRMYLKQFQLSPSIW